MPIDLASWASSKAQTSPDEYLKSSMKVMDTANKQGKDRPFNYNTAVANYRGWIYAAIWMNAKAVATTPLRLYARKGKGESLAKTSPIPIHRKRFMMGKSKRQPSASVLHKAVEWGGEFEEVTDKNPITDLLARPNPWMLGQEFCSLRLMFTMLTGNFYMHPVVESVRYEGKGLSRIKELWVMPSQFVKIQPGNPTEEDYIKGYWYGVDQTRMHMFEPDEVMHMRQPNPRDQLYGLGQVEAAWDTQRLSIAQRETDQSRYDNLSRPDLAVITKSANMPLAQLKELQEEWARLFRGTFRQGAPVFLTGDTQVIPLLYQPTEIGDKEIIIEEIAAITGVPVSLLKANDPNLASAQVGFASWREQTILPYCRMDEEFLNAHLMPTFGNEDSAFLCYDDPVPENRDEVRQDLAAFLDKGMITLNEGRVSEGYDPVDEENADKLLLPAGRVPIDKVGEAPPSFGGFSIGGGGNDRKPMNDEDDKKDAAKRLYAFVTKQVYQSHGIYQKADADDTARDGESERLIRQLQLSVARVFAMQRKSCIAAMHGRKAGDAGLLARAIAAIIKTDDDMATAIEPFMNKILGMGGKAGLIDIGLTPDVFDVTNPKVAEFMRQYTIRLAGEINGFTAQQLTETLSVGLDEGESISELSNRVSELYNDFEGYRSEAIARTESARAFTDGTAQAWSDSDAVAGKTWGLAAGGCRICKVIASKYGTTPIPLDQPFYQLGASIPLDDGKVYHVDYAAIMGPPGHPNCRCAIKAVLK